MQANCIRKNKKIIVVLLILSVVCIVWRLYPRMLVPRMFPSDEYINVGFVLWLVERNGNPYDAFHNPHLGYFLVYFVHSISGIDVSQIMFTINPVISGLTVFPFFLFASKILSSKKQVIIATLFFTFSETMFYRTCHYGSTEALGLCLMFVYLAVYLRATSMRRKVFSVLLLIMIPFAHVLPFIFAVVFTFSDLFLKKKRMLVLCLVLGSTFLIFNPIFPPHRFVASEFAENVFALPSGIASVINKLFLYSPSDIVSHFPFFMGTISMLFLCLVSFKNASKLEKLVLVLILLGIIPSLLLYNTRLIAPTRLLAYMSIPLYTMTARILTESPFRYVSKKTFAIVLIVILMLSSPVIGGLNKFVWINDSITDKELQAINYLSSKELFNNDGGTYWYADLPVKQYISAYWGGSVDYKYQNKTICFHYVFLSERMEKNGFFITIVSGRRTVEERRPVIDIWAHNETKWQDYYYEEGLILKGWTLIYVIEGIKVYEADCYLVEDPTERYVW